MKTIYEEQLKTNIPCDYYEKLILDKLYIYEQMNICQHYIISAVETIGMRPMIFEEEIE